MHFNWLTYMERQLNGFAQLIVCPVAQLSISVPSFSLRVSSAGRHFYRCSLSVSIYLYLTLMDGLRIVVEIITMLSHKPHFCHFAALFIMMDLMWSVPWPEHLSLKFLILGVVRIMKFIYYRAKLSLLQKKMNLLIYYMLSRIYIYIFVF